MDRTIGVIARIVVAGLLAAALLTDLVPRSGGAQTRLPDLAAVRTADPGDPVDLGPPLTRLPPTTTIADSPIQLAIPTVPPGDARPVAPGSAEPTDAVPTSPASPPSSSPATAEAPAAQPPTPENRIGYEALAALDFPAQSVIPGWTIEFEQGRTSLLGATWPDQRTIEIYVREAQTVEEVAHVVAHEIGHAIDVTHFGSAERAQWRSARGFAPTTAWFAGAGETDYATPAGDWAEAFAVWQVGPDRYRGLAAPPPVAAQLELVAELALG